MSSVFGSSAARFVAYLGLCAAYLQGGLVKLMDFPGSIAEMAHFGLSPAPLFAVLVILLELGASGMILSGWQRWLGALGLAGFTLLATGIALRFWEMPAGHERFMAANSFFEHLGLDVFPTFDRRLLPRVVDQDAADHLRGHGEEVSPALPLRILLAAEPQIDFMHQRRALQSLRPRLLLQVIGCQPPEVLVHEWHQGIERTRIPAAPTL